MPELLKQIEDEVLSLLSKNLNEKSLCKLKLLQISYSLIKSGRFINKRSVYYQAVNIFKSQANVDLLTIHFMKKFNCEMNSLHIRPGLKGIFCGTLEFVFENKSTSILKGQCLIPDMNQIVTIKHSYSLVIVVEKETILSRVLNRKYLVVCGKGYPCYNTLRLLQKLEPKVRMVCLTDFDPHGLHIFLVYKRNVQELERLGLSAVDILNWKIRRDECIRLKDNEIKKINKIRTNDSLLCDDLNFMEGLNFKIELEAIFNQNDFEITEYLRFKGINLRD